MIRVRIAACFLLAVCGIAMTAPLPVFAKGAGKSSFLDCKKGGYATGEAVLQKMQEKWPLTTVRVATVADTYLLILNYGADEQYRVDKAKFDGRDADEDSRPPPEPDGYATRKPYNALDANNLGLMFHQFADGTLLNDADKKGYIAWDDATLARQTITDRSLSLLREWASGNTRTTINCADSTGTIVADGERPLSALPTAPAPDAKLAKHSNTGRGFQDLVAGFYLRGSSSALTQAAGDNVVKNLNSDRDDLPNMSAGDNSASIGFHHDQIDHTANTFTMHLALGYGFGGSTKPKDGPPPPVWSDTVFLLPYLTVDRINKSDPKQTKNNQTDIGLGGAIVHVSQWNYAGGVAWNPLAPAIFRWSVRAQGDTDDTFGASILYIAGQASYAPRFLTCMTKVVPVTDYLRFACNYNADIDYGHIFSAGDFMNLNQKEYARAGFDVATTVYGPDSANNNANGTFALWTLTRDFLSRLSYTAGYKVLRDFSGTHADLARFDSSINFKLTPDGGDGPSTSMGLSYTNGRADVTLLPQRYWELQFKASF